MAVLPGDSSEKLEPSVRATRPKVGRRPVVPQRMQGETMEPSVSVPMAKRIPALAWFRGAMGLRFPVTRFSRTPYE